MRFHADLHIHSKHSRATSKHADLEHLAYWAGKKGISVVATGDFTHPVWLAELKEKLVPAEPGLFRLQRDIEPGDHGQTAARVRRPDPVHALGRDLHHLQEGRAHAEGPPPHLCAGLRGGRSRGRQARAHRQPGGGRPPHPRPRFARPFGDHPRLERGRLPGSGPYLDSVVRGPRLALRLRFRRRVLRRPRRPHLRPRDRALVGSADELAHLGARPLPAGVQLRRPLAGQARARDHAVRHGYRLLRAAPRARDGRRLRGHRRVLPGGRQVPPRRTPQVRHPADARGDAGARRPLPGLRQAGHRRRLAPGGGARRPLGGGGPAARHRRRDAELRAAARGAGGDRGSRLDQPQGGANLRAAGVVPRLRAVHPGNGSGRGHRPRRVARPGGGHLAAALGRGDPRGRVRRGVRRHPHVRSGGTPAPYRGWAAVRPTGLCGGRRDTPLAGPDANGE